MPDSMAHCYGYLVFTRRQNFLTFWFLSCVKCSHAYVTSLHTATQTLHHLPMPFKLKLRCCVAEPVAIVAFPSLEDRAWELSNTVCKSVVAGGLTASPTATPS